MSRVEEFDSFYDSTRRYMLLLTYALCGDRTTAGAAVADAYRHAWQQWPKLRGRDSLEYLRNESWRLSMFERGKHPWRRRREEDSDLSLITALQRLSPNARRLIVLQCLGEVGLGSAARDVGMTTETATRLTQTAIASLEQSMSTDLADIEDRLRRLARVSDQITLPDSHGIRRESRQRMRRNTVVAVAVAAAVIAGAGIVATESASMNHADAAPAREQVGADLGDETEPTTRSVAEGVGADQLLDASGISRLHKARNWRVTGTDADASRSEPYTVCAPRRFADRRARNTLVRSFSAGGRRAERAVETVEVSRSPKAAGHTYERMVRWYANCAVPRVQLIDSYTLEQPEGDTKIFRLRRWQGPDRTITVGVSHTGVVTSALVHSVNGTEGADVKDFAGAVRDSLSAVCDQANGQCPGAGDDKSESVEATLPAPSSHAQAFLSIVDLPPVASIDAVWAGTGTMKAHPNPAATLCDKATFTGTKVQKARSRIFVIPEEKRLPREFGISETIGRFKNVKSAKRFVGSVEDRVGSCEKDNLSASTAQRSAFTEKSMPGATIQGQTWKISFEINKSKKVFYRVALVRRGRDVAQVSFSPTKRFDVEPKAFKRLARRSGERLAYLH